MVNGLGVDIIEIDRIKKSIKNYRFISRNFTAKEIDYFISKNNNPETIAGNFAAKEAVSKVLGTGFRGFNFIDIEVLRNDFGKPYVLLHNGAKVSANEKNINEILVSISHSKLYAIANCIGLGGKNNETNAK
ncbi:holo-ACP synthase [Helicovermis profundi]|uniref:Holo-[acyl-carrier-protein] synthase n=1 Tax=Helicovermis profundi TaxID=3065157 RepID=A0AAU9E1L9_9FIRM|nr:holo-ACP synthase [Clostridia bacterium S502]